MSISDIKRLISKLLHYGPGKYIAIIVPGLMVGVMSGCMNIVFREILRKQGEEY